LKRITHECGDRSVISGGRWNERFAIPGGDVEVLAFELRGGVAVVCGASELDFEICGLARLVCEGCGEGRESESGGEEGGEALHFG